MKFLKFLAIFVVIFSAVGGNTTYRSGGNASTEVVSYSVSAVWESNSECSCTRGYDRLLKDLQSYYDGCEQAVSGYLGVAKDKATNAVDSFQNYLSKLIYYANSRSAILSVSAKRILEALALCKHLGQNSLIMLSEFNKVFPDISTIFKDVALNVADHLDNLAESFRDAVNNLSCVFSKYMDDVLHSYRATGCKTLVSSEPTLKKFQKLLNRMTLIVETLTKKCDGSLETQESVIVLTLMVWYLHIVVEGKMTDQLDLLARNKRQIPETTVTYLIAIDYVLGLTTDAFSAVLLPLTKSIFNEFRRAIVNVNSALNTEFKDIGVGRTL